jgi:methyl-accepting chemotaxis protein
MKRTWRRKNYFIKRELQGKYIFRFFIFVIVGSLFFTMILGLLSFDTMTIVYNNSSLQVGKTPIVLLKEILRAHWIFIVTVGVFVVFSSMFLTHRFAGPLYRFEKSVEEMTRGNFAFEIKLRSKDEAKELAEMINTFNMTLSSRLKEIRDIAEDLSIHLADARSSAEHGDMAVKLDKAVSLNKHLGELLRGFKLKNDE